MYKIHLHKAVLTLFCVVAAVLPTACASSQSVVNISVDAGKDNKPIHPEVYGVAFASPSALRDLRSPINRSGGNATTQYNWKLNASNRGDDWYFESIADDSATPGASGDSFVKDSLAGGARPMITIPMIGWVAKLGPNRGTLPSFSVAKYGPQKKTDPGHPDYGNGVKPDDTKIVNDPNDANTPADDKFEQDWVRHLVAKWGTSDKGGVPYYLLDNEPSIWQGTHRDVHPKGATYDEMYNKTVAYAKAIKAVDPGAMIVGPEEWGWNGYKMSGYDQQWGGDHHWQGDLPDRKAHGGQDFMPWLLDKMAAYEKTSGKRLLDVFTAHIYPQSGEFGDDTSEAMQLKRNRSTRSLWDPNYVDESWIKDTIRLIPRLKEWVDGHYPGTKIGITEYNWGAENHINGATAQADILGIFGREGLDVGARWTTPDPKTPTYKAIKIYRNYDGNGGAFGDVSVQDNVPNPDTISSFAAKRSSDGALTVIVINKDLHSDANVHIALKGFAPGAEADAWQLTSANEITHLPKQSVGSDEIAAAVPAQSITLYVVPAK